MEHQLSVIDDVFELQDRGCVVFPGIPVDSPYAVRVGDPIRLERPDGSSLNANVRGIEMIETTPVEPQPIPILMPSHIRKVDIPIGTIVVLLDARLSGHPQDQAR